MGFFFDELDSHARNTALVLKNRTQISYKELSELANQFQKIIGNSRKLIMIEMANELDPIIAYLACLREKHPAILVYPENPQLITQIKNNYKPDIIYEKIDGKYVINYQSEETVFLNNLSSDLSIVLSTSGSTGSAKCIRLSAENLNANARSIVEYLELDSSQKAITNLPLHYSYLTFRASELLNFSIFPGWF
ncbi:MAG: hypothetical protein JXB48_24835 [Candidatus Latescibacteria bacterium]|nr:hypothetical protein [Candidatus Latescibacterota bacterium]